MEMISIYFQLPPQRLITLFFVKKKDKLDKNLTTASVLCILPIRMSELTPFLQI